MYYGSGHLFNQSLYDPVTDQHTEIRHSEHDKLHREINRQQGSLTTTYKHDPMGRLLSQNSLTDKAVIDRQYHYDAIGQLTDINGHSVLGNDKTIDRHHQYQYDKHGRLTAHSFNDATGNQLTEGFAFDPASNRVPLNSTNAAQNSNTKSASKGRPTELITNSKRIRYTYDAQGGIKQKVIEPIQTVNQSENSLIQQKTDIVFTYNANNELINTRVSNHSGTKKTVTSTDYYYDAFGRRIHKISQTDGQPKTKIHILWDGDNAIQEYTDTHVYSTIYDEGSFVPVARIVALKSSLKQSANDEDAVDNESMHSDKQVFYYHNDQLGTPNELTNDKGQVVWLADYEAYGNVAKVVWREEQLGQIKVTSDELQPLRFQGQSFDAETGLHYNRFRYYDPDMGMFISRDPIGLMGGDNVFAYAPNPTGWIDPLGLRFTGYSMDDAHLSLRKDPNVSPATPIKWRANHQIGGYSKSQIYKRWLKMEAKFAKGRMEPCPPKVSDICTSCSGCSGIIKLDS